MEKKEWIKLIRFGTVGSSGLVIDMGLTWFFKEKMDVQPYLSHTLGFLCAVINNYLLNKCWTFGEQDKISTRQFLAFLLVSLIGLGMGTLCLAFIFDVLNYGFYVAKVLAILFVSVWNYLINRFVVFNRAQLSNNGLPLYHREM